MSTLIETYQRSGLTTIHRSTTLQAATLYTVPAGKRLYVTSVWLTAVATGGGAGTYAMGAGSEDTGGFFNFLGVAFSGSPGFQSTTGNPITRINAGGSIIVLGTLVAALYFAGFSGWLDQ